MKTTLASLALLFSVLFVAGCSGEPLEKALVGAWVEDEVDRRAEFTPNHLYAVVTNGAPVEMGVWSVRDGKEVVMDCLLEKRQTVWNCRLDGEELVILGDKAFERRFARVPRDSRTALFDQRLEGVWRSDDREPEVVEFTPTGALVALFQRLDDEKALRRLGGWAKVSRESSNAFLLQGQMGSAKMVHLLPHKFAIEGDKLKWGGGRKRLPKVYRKVTPTEVRDMLEKVPDAPAPSQSATASPSPASR